MELGAGKLSKLSQDLLHTLPQGPTPQSPSKVRAVANTTAYTAKAVQVFGQSISYY